MPDSQEKKKFEPMTLSEVNQVRENIQVFRSMLETYFIDRKDVIDMMLLCTIMREPLLLVGEPGTGKSDLIVKFCEALHVEQEDYFEYMLTQFTEPSELFGPVDIQQLKKGNYIRKTRGMLPEARVAFLDEIFTSNSAILNSLLSIINERKFYQEGKAMSVQVDVLFAATNDIPTNRSLRALRDRFVIKMETRPVYERFFDQLLVKGLESKNYKNTNQKPWSRSLISLDHLISLGFFIENRTQLALEKDRFSKIFPNELRELFFHLILSLEKDLHVHVSDRKIVKLTNLIIAHAFLFHGGTVQRDDLSILKYIANTQDEMQAIYHFVQQRL
jgi:MoxR-like ATPase